MTLGRGSTSATDKATECDNGSPVVSYLVIKTKAVIPSRFNTLSLPLPSPSPTYSPSSWPLEEKFATS